MKLREYLTEDDMNRIDESGIRYLIESTEKLIDRCVGERLKAEYRRELAELKELLGICLDKKEAKTA